LDVIVRAVEIIGHLRRAARVLLDVLEGPAPGGLVVRRIGVVTLGHTIAFTRPRSR
jgi:hypothetical protein